MDRCRRFEIGGTAPLGTLTILANSFRVTGHVLRRWRAGEIA